MKLILKKLYPSTDNKYALKLNKINYNDTSYGFYSPNYNLMKTC